MPLPTQSDNELIQEVKKRLRAIRGFSLHSTAARWAKYDEQLRILVLSFNDGDTYWYFDVSSSEVEQLKRADSQGEFINREIKKHRYVVEPKDD